MSAEVVFALLTWLAANGYPWEPSYGLPEVHMGTQDDVVAAIEYRAGEDIPPEDELALAASVVAIYDHENRIITMGNLYSGEYERRVTLLHELVHFLQHASGEEFQCAAAMELDAYLLQEQWLHEQGHPPMTDMFTIIVRSSCGFG